MSLLKSSQGFLLCVRNIQTSSARYKTVPVNLRGKNKTAQDWLTRQLNDPYVKKSRYDNYRARSAYKLLQLDAQYKFLKPGMTVIDCGAAPGSWTQVLVRSVNADKQQTDSPIGKVVSVDIVPFEPVRHAHCFGEMDFLDHKSLAKTFDVLNGSSSVCEAVVSDMAPKATGITSIDHESVCALSYSALGFALKMLKSGGTFICKMWHGNRTPELRNDLSNHFDLVDIAKPDASRVDSAEVYFVARKFRGL